jgi:N-acetylglucosamine-6-phosphate deacetylase
VRQSLCIALNHCVQNLIGQRASLNPAASLGVQGQVGSIAPGKVADFVVCSPDFAKKRVYLAGKLV